MASVGSSGFEFSESGVSEDAGRLLLLCKPQTPREMINRRYGRANSRLAVTQATEREHFLKRRLNTEWSLNNVPQVHHRERNLKVWSETGTKISCFRFKFHLLHVGLSNFQPKHVPGSRRQTSTAGKHVLFYGTIIKMFHVPFTSLIQIIYSSLAWSIPDRKMILSDIYLCWWCEAFIHCLHR